MISGSLPAMKHSNGKPLSYICQDFTIMNFRRQVWFAKDVNTKSTRPGDNQWVDFSWENLNRKPARFSHEIWECPVTCPLNQPIYPQNWSILNLNPFLSFAMFHGGVFLFPVPFSLRSLQTAAGAPEGKKLRMSNNLIKKDKWDNMYDIFIKDLQTSGVVPESNSYAPSGKGWRMHHMIRRHSIQCPLWRRVKRVV